MTDADTSLPHRHLEELTVADLQQAMDAGELSAVELTNMYQERIEVIDYGPIDLRSIMELNPEAVDIAHDLDQERRQGNVRGPLHGIPILLKDNIDTDDQMLTTAGSLALVDSRPTADATVVARLREAGAVILGKTNLSEWANFRAPRSTSGWSARRGVCRNPYALDRNPCGSSSGSGAAVSANLAALAIGTETDGSIVCPSSANGIVGLKPTVGLTSRAGVIPISRTQDSVGPMARTVADAAAVLGAIAGFDQRDPATEAAADHRFGDYRQFVDPDGLDGARIGIARQLLVEFTKTNAVFEAAVEALIAAGAVVVDPVEFPSYDELEPSSAEFDVLLCEFKTDIALYLETRAGGPKTLGELIAFNQANDEAELAWFGQEIFELSESRGGIDDPGYQQALADSRRIARTEGLDVVLAEHNLDAIVAPTLSPAWLTDPVNGDHHIHSSATYAAMAGYPLITVPMGAVSGLPVGLSFMGLAWSEPTLIKLASGFEAQRGPRLVPRFAATAG